jgi:hypothetical protein
MPLFRREPPRSLSMDEICGTLEPDPAEPVSPSAPLADFVGDSCKVGRPVPERRCWILSVDFSIGFPPPIPSPKLRRSLVGDEGEEGVGGEVGDLRNS